MADFVTQLDAQIADLLAGWNVYSTIIFTSILGYLVYLVVSSQDPDIHPMLLQRQATASLVRKQGESAVYRAADTPHGFPLRTGLNVKAAGAPAYAGGRDGDLRDVWRRVTGDIPLEQTKGVGAEAQGKILTVFGREEVVEHSVADITKEIVILGSYLQKSGAQRVAIYLPNSIEFLTALFACAFYGLTPILIPYNQPHPTVISQLAKTKADALIGQAGSLPLDLVGKQYKGIKQVIWVVEKTSRHVDWTEVPGEIGKGVEVGMWHQIVQDHASDTTLGGLPDIDAKQVKGLVTIWLGTEERTVEFSQKNLVAGLGALLHTLPLRQRLSPSDLFLSADAWTSTYPLLWTLAALFSHASVAINSVASAGVSLSAAAQSIAPTVIVASAETAEQLHADNKLGVIGGLKKIAHATAGSALDSGVMPGAGFLPSHRASIGATPGKLRLLLIAERVGADTPPISSHDLSDLRIFTGARVVYALTAASVAGAVAQSGVFDYRRHGSRTTKHAHFGPPLSSVEVKVKDSGPHRTSDHETKGEIIVAGPAVAGGEANLGIVGRFNDDATLAYV